MVVGAFRSVLIQYKSRHFEGSKLMDTIIPAEGRFAWTGSVPSESQPVRDSLLPSSRWKANFGTHFRSSPTPTIFFLFSFDVITPQKSVAHQDLTVGTLPSRGSNSISKRGFWGSGRQETDFGGFLDRQKGGRSLARVRLG